jgi:4a-hydroxytetrahydrobiopterin dehydratase
MSPSLTKKKCVPCEGPAAAVSRDQALKHLKEIDGWELSPDAKMIRRAWIMKNFVQGVKAIEAIKNIAESEGHHPDVHLTGYKNLTFELYTHSIGGLSENDFIVAAKINQIMDPAR